MIQTIPENHPHEPSAFEALGLAPRLCDAVATAGYRTPTPIQHAAIPSVLAGRDLLGCAQTGTGKTAAFALPILHQLAAEPRGRRPAVRALVLAPTRELAAQIADSFTRYAKGTGIRTFVVFGGVGRVPQVRALTRPPEVLVATPGRLLDLMGTRDVSLAEVRHVVLDEADRMLDMGFVRDVRRIMAAVPARRQCLLFSATMPPEIAALAADVLDRPEHVAVDPVASTCEPIEQSVYFVESAQKLRLLVDVLQRQDVERALVFTRTKHGANRVAQGLARASIGAAAIHGNKSQSARERALAEFRRGTTRVVVATDLASRGLDVRGITHVVNYDIPVDAESYVHRVGRTGRAGASGIAVSFCSSGERSALASIERLTRRRLVRLATDGSPAPDAPEPREHRPASATIARNRRRSFRPARRAGRR